VSASRARTYLRATLALLRAAWQEFERDHARYLATAMVYYALISLVPTPRVQWQDQNVVIPGS